MNHTYGAHSDDISDTRDCYCDEPKKEVVGVNITITTKAGKFVMKGEEMAHSFEEFLRERWGYETKNEVTERAWNELYDFLSTYEEEVKTEGEDCNSPYHFRCPKCRKTYPVEQDV